MKARVSILFYAKKAKANKEDLVPIYTRITISGKRIELSTNRFVKFNQWSKEGNCMKGNSILSSNTNKYLDVLRLQIIGVQMELINEKVPITAESLKHKLLGTEIEKRMLIPIFEDHNNKIKALIGQEYSPGTLERYQTSLKHTQEFLKWKYKSSDIDIKKIDHVFITEYDFWLRSVRKCANNTAVKYMLCSTKIPNRIK
ncbi:phage integrase SAM-like domain and Arm DNA-binding domain-containing protein [Chryseobacterium sp.]|uniref:phage integrase SAM-like domain and Arm DNA-binding domain-containing protein n=1 Tax=Chryseobacterium sp. TaxID=1871047 RepID=UPI002FC5C9E4